MGFKKKLTQQLDQHTNTKLFQLYWGIFHYMVNIFVNINFFSLTCYVKQSFKTPSLFLVNKLDQKIFFWKYRHHTEYK